MTRQEEIQLQIENLELLIAVYEQGRDLKGHSLTRVEAEDLIELTEEQIARLQRQMKEGP